MYGQSTSNAAISASGERMYKVKVSNNVARLGGPASLLFRRSNYTLTIPYDRLTSEMTRIVKTGAKIVSVTPVVS
ncbi:MAG: phycobilisome linker polypeptide [Gloeobacterales cyanobacterium]